MQSKKASIPATEKDFDNQPAVIDDIRTVDSIKRSYHNDRQRPKGGQQKTRLCSGLLKSGTGTGGAVPQCEMYEFVCIVSLL